MDGLHERAGSQDVVKLHGDIWLLRCTRCGREERNEQVPWIPCLRFAAVEGFCVPAIVWFGEMLPARLSGSAPWRQPRTADVFLAIGTSALVYPAAGLVQVARQSGARVAIVNPDPTPADELAEWILRGPAGEILPRLL